MEMPKGLIVEKNSFLAALGNVIKREREKKGISQGQLATLCGWKNGASRISNYEHGEREPSLFDLNKIAKALNNYAVNDLIRMAENKKTTISQFHQFPVTFKTFPLLKMSEISKWIEKPVITEHHKIISLPDIVGHTGTISAKAFVMELTDESVADHIYRNKSQHEKIYGIFDLEAEPVHNQVVLIETKVGKMFRVYVKDGETVSFRSCDPYNPTTLEDKDIKILAIAKGFYNGF